MAAAYVAAVDRMTVGQLVPGAGPRATGGRGQPLAAEHQGRHTSPRCAPSSATARTGAGSARASTRAAVSPRRRSVRALIGPDPRVIADDVLGQAALGRASTSSAGPPGRHAQPAASSLPAGAGPGAGRRLALRRAAHATRSAACAVGCVRWQRDDVAIAGIDRGAAPRTRSACSTCRSTRRAPPSPSRSTAPSARPSPPGRRAARRSRPAATARPASRSHYSSPTAASRSARTTSTAPSSRSSAARPASRSATRAAPSPATAPARPSPRQLFNAKEPMTLFELQAWLGHRSPQSTQHYARITPTTAGQGLRRRRLLRAATCARVEVLVDRDAVASGGGRARASPGGSTTSGHGYCTYDFFDQCPHRMACAKCAFYRPKGSSQPPNCSRARRTCCGCGRSSRSPRRSAPRWRTVCRHMERLLAQLADVPTPAGPTPQQLRGDQDGAGQAHRRACCTFLAWFCRWRGPPSAKPGTVR